MSVFPPQPPKTLAEFPEPPPLSSSDDSPMAKWERTKQLALAINDRQREALSLFQPLEVGEMFHSSRAKVRIIRGGNRSGKTMHAMRELAVAVCGLDPHNKYPKENGRAFVIGKNWKHVADVFHEYLLVTAGFKIIEDEKTGKWRTYQPWKDKHRKKEAQPAPGFLPPRLVDDIAWEEKKRRTFSSIYMKNGWTIKTFSSESDPPVGSAVDLVLVDEDIEQERWISEMLARLPDREGKFVWATLPYSKNNNLYDLCKQAEEDAGTAKPIVEQFVLRLDDNPYITDSEKKDLRRLYSEEEWMMRGDGEFGNNQYMVWPTFNMAIHGLKPSDLPDGQVPPHWCRYMIVDPGRQVCAVLFAALPPPNEGDFVLLESELYIRNCTADLFGRRVKEHVGGKRFQAFCIDKHGSMQHEMGSGVPVWLQYSEALKNNRVASLATGHGFIPGSGDIAGRELRFASWLDDRSGGRGPKLRVLAGHLPKFEWEIARFKKVVTRDIIQDKGDYKKHAHLMACAGYLAMLDPKYVAPPRIAPADWNYGAILQQVMERKNSRQGDDGDWDYVNLGPGGNSAA